MSGLAHNLAMWSTNWPTSAGQT